MSKQAKTVQELMDELSALVAWFESDDFTLEEATKQFAKAEALAAEIEKQLGEFKNEINGLKQKFD